MGNNIYCQIKMFHKETDGKSKKWVNQKVIDTSNNLKDLYWLTKKILFCFYYIKKGKYFIKALLMKVNAILIVLQLICRPTGPKNPGKPSIQNYVVPKNVIVLI